MAKKRNEAMLLVCRKEYADLCEIRDVAYQALKTQLVKLDRQLDDLRKTNERLVRLCSRQEMEMAHLTFANKRYENTNPPTGPVVVANAFGDAREGA